MDDTAALSAGLLRPKFIKLVDMDGKERTYILSKIPASYSREIIAKWTMSALPNVRDYDINHEMMMRLMSYVAVPVTKDKALRITTRELLDNHVPDVQTLEALEAAMAQYCWGFFLPDVLSRLGQKMQGILREWVAQIMTGSSTPSSAPASPPSTNSGPSIP